jgi:hypothetical protein
MTFRPKWGSKSTRPSSSSPHDCFHLNLIVTQISGNTSDSEKIPSTKLRVFEEDMLRASHRQQRYGHYPLTFLS